MILCTQATLLNLQNIYLVLYHAIFSDHLSGNDLCALFHERIDLERHYWEGIPKFFSPKLCRTNHFFFIRFDLETEYFT